MVLFKAGYVTQVFGKSNPRIYFTYFLASIGMIAIRPVVHELYDHLYPS